MVEADKLRWVEHKEIGGNNNKNHFLNFFMRASTHLVQLFITGTQKMGH